MSSLNDAALMVPPSGIREIVNLVIDRGGDVCRLEVGEPDFATPDHIVAAGVAAAQAGARYTQSAGVATLREAIAARMARVAGIEIAPPDVIVTQGGVQACSLVMSALLVPGSELLISDPAWTNYEMLARLHRAIPVHYPLRASQGFVPDPDEIEALITPRTAAIVVNSPCNPTGSVFPPDVMSRIVDIAARRDVMVVSDEVYDELTFEGEPAHAVALDRERVVGIYSFSKTYAMTGWRVGYVVPPPSMAPLLWVLQEPLVGCISAVSQAAALAALEGDQGCVTQMRDQYRRRRDVVVDLLSGAGLDVVTPLGAFYVMCPLAPGADSRSAALDLVDHGVAVAPGTAFGAEAADHVRISLASSEAELRRGIGRLLQWRAATGGGAALSGAAR